MNAEVLRTEQINLKLNAEELARLERMAAHYAISPQSVLRMILKRASDDLDETLRLAARSQPGLSLATPSRTSRDKKPKTKK